MVPYEPVFFLLSLPDVLYTVCMHADIQSDWEQAESLKADVLARVAAMPESARSVSAKTGDWTPLQVLSHLLIAERFVAGFVPPKGESPGRMASPLVIGLLCNVMRAGIALPAPDVMAPDPQPMPLETLAREWGRERQQLKESLADVAPDAPFGVHPYFGVITTRQMIGMLAAHMTYHAKRFPKAAR